jgi:succinoglycan biosynthesis protein ExoA
MSDLAALPPLDPDAAVSVVIPARGAAGLIGDCLAAVLPQLRADDEVVVAAADAATADAVRALAVDEPRLRVVTNPDGTTPAALNRAIAAGDRPVVLRVDAQARLPEGYRDRTVALLAATGAAVVGGRQVARAGHGFAAAVAAAMNAPLGHGGAAYRSGAGAGPVDTVYLGVFRRDVLAAVGGYDERFRTNQDAELNERIRRAGGTVLLDPGLAVGYLPRGDVGALARQFRGYGRGRALTARRHPGSLRPRQLAAPVLVAGLAAAAGLAVVGAVLGAGRWTAVPLGLGAAGYGALLVIGALRAGPAARRRLPAVVVALATMHLAWGTGFLSTVLGPGRAAVGTAPGRRGRTTDRG